MIANLADAHKQITKALYLSLRSLDLKFKNYEPNENSERRILQQVIHPAPISPLSPTFNEVKYETLA